MGANADAQRERVETAHQTLAARATSPASVRAANVACVRACACAGKLKLENMSISIAGRHCQLGSPSRYLLSSGLFP